MKSNIHWLGTVSQWILYDLIKCKLEIDNVKQILVVPPKRLHKIKLEDVIVILTLSLFLAEIMNILYRI